MDRDAPEADEEEREFLRIEYVARSENGHIVDTTDPDAASDSDLVDLEGSGPVVVVPGEGHLFEPVEDAVTDAQPGATVEVTVEPEEAFGSVDPRETVTLDERAVPADSREPGTSLQLGGRRAVIEGVDDGTVTVDFNHPLAGVTLEYVVEILEAIEGTGNRARGLLTTHGLRDATVEFTPESNALELRLSGASPSLEQDTRKRAYVADVRRLLPVESVTVIEEYDDR